MSGKLTRAAYDRLIAENLAWLDAQPRTLEREHIRLIVERSAGHEYPSSPPEANAERELGYKRALANVASVLRLARERGGTVHLTRGAGYEAIINEVDALIEAECVRLATGLDAVAETRRLVEHSNIADACEFQEQAMGLQEAADYVRTRGAK